MRISYLKFIFKLNILYKKSIIVFEQVAIFFKQSYFVFATQQIAFLQSLHLYKSTITHYPFELTTTFKEFLQQLLVHALFRHYTFSQQARHKRSCSFTIT